MSDENFNELAGRIQGLSDLICGLISELDERGIIYSPEFACRMARLADNRSANGYQESARQTLRHLAKLIEDEHDYREAKAQSQENRDAFERFRSGSDADDTCA
jgi:hypothetical protein